MIKLPRTQIGGHGSRVTQVLLSFGIAYVRAKLAKITWLSNLTIYEDNYFILKKAFKDFGTKLCHESCFDSQINFQFEIRSLITERNRQI